MADDSLHVEILGLEFNNGLDADGVEWNLDVIDDAPDVEGGVISPTGRHGVALGPQFRRARRLIPSGVVVAPTQALAWAARERLAGLGFAVEGDIVWQETPAKFITVTQARPARLTQPVGGMFDYELELVAAFPFRRSFTAVTTALSGTVTITNDGTVPAFPTLEVTSGGTVDLSIGGRTFTTASVPAGTVIDMWARTIKDGAGVTVAPWPKVSASEWLSLPPGASPVTQSGSAGVDLIHFHTYA